MEGKKEKAQIVCETLSSIMEYIHSKNESVSVNPYVNVT